MCVHSIHYSLSSVLILASKLPSSGLQRPQLSGIPSVFQKAAPGVRPPSARINTAACSTSDKPCGPTGTLKVVRLCAFPVLFCFSAANLQRGNKRIILKATIKKWKNSLKVQLQLWYSLSMSTKINIYMNRNVYSSAQPHRKLPRWWIFIC